MGAYGKLSYLVFLFCSASAYEYGTVCPLTLENCGYDCYDPSKSDCLDDGDRVCPKGQIGCGKYDCYSPDTHYCADRIVCPKGHLTCEFDYESRCYDPSTQNCTKSGAICLAGQEGCGDQCYSPDDETCHSSERWHTVCKNSESICGMNWGMTCYDPKNATCQITQGYLPIAIVCKSGELGCGDKCYSPDNPDIKCLNANYEYKLCRNGEELCGWTCYDPNTHTCTNNRTICEFGVIACGFHCYSPHNETCFKADPDLPAYMTVKCLIGHSPCDYNSCYDPGTEICLQNYYYSERKVVCPIGSKVCGDVCYDPLSDDKTCFNAKRGILCSHGQLACREKCYTPGPGVTCDEYHNLICENGEKSCRDSCYNPETHKCY